MEKYEFIEITEYEEIYEQPKDNDNENVETTME